MTDSTSWQPPAGGTASGPAAPFSPPVPPVAPNPYGPPQPQPAAGWTPPPKPGLIPLRPLTLGTILAASFQVLRRNPRPTFGLALLVTSAMYILGFGVVGVVAFLAFSRVQSATSGGDADAIAAGATGLTLLSALIPVALGIVGTAILQGIVSLEVARGTLGEKLKLRGLWAAARGRIGALIGWSLLISAAIIVAIAILAGLIAVVVAFGGTGGVVAAVLLGLLLGAGALVLGFWLSTKLALVPSALMLERLRLRAAIARSWSLTGGYFWKTLGILLLVAVIVGVATNIVTAPFNFLISIGASFVTGTGDMTAFVTTMLVGYVLLIVITVVFGALAAVIQSATPVLVYLDLRMRKEGLDLELSRFVEARQAGDTTVADPYLVRAGGAPQAPAAGSPWS